MQEDDFHSNVCDFFVPVIIIQVKRAEWRVFPKHVVKTKAFRRQSRCLSMQMLCTMIQFGSAAQPDRSWRLECRSGTADPNRVKWLDMTKSRKKWNKNIMRLHSLTGIPPTRCSCVCWCSMPAQKSCLKHINWINYSRQVMKCQDRFPLNLYAQSKPTVIHHDGINHPQIYAVTKTWVKNKGDECSRCY